MDSTRILFYIRDALAYRRSGNLILAQSRALSAYFEADGFDDFAYRARATAKRLYDRLCDFNRRRSAGLRRA